MAANDSTQLNQQQGAAPTNNNHLNAAPADVNLQGLPSIPRSTSRFGSRLSVNASVSFIKVFGRNPI